MGKFLTACQIEARIEALNECAMHMEAQWTDDPLERKQGYYVVKWLGIEMNRLGDMKAEAVAREKLAKLIQNG